MKLLIDIFWAYKIFDTISKKCCKNITIKYVQKHWSFIFRRFLQLLQSFKHWLLKCNDIVTSTCQFIWMRKIMRKLVYLDIQYWYPISKTSKQFNQLSKNITKQKLMIWCQFFYLVVKLLYHIFHNNLKELKCIVLFYCLCWLKVYVCIKILALLVFVLLQYYYL